jgi:putative Holliday junction resolvase
LSSPAGTPPAAQPGPCLGLDLGEARIGVALTDSARSVAVPRGVLARRGDQEADHEAVARLVAETGATLVVVGLPLSLDGGTGPAAVRIGAEVERLRVVLAVPVATIDERFSTVEASRRRREGDDAATARRGPRPGSRARARRTPVDAGAAAVILQAYVDGERSR